MDKLRMRQAGARGRHSGGVIGLTLGLAAPEEGPLQQGADQLVNTADFWANTESATATSGTTSSISVSATSSITSTTSEISTPSITDTSEVYQRYVTSSELEELNHDPVLVPGESTGKAYFTTDIYNSRAAVYDRLSLYEPKDYRISFSFEGTPDITGPDLVPQRFTPTGEFITHGGGTEYFIREIARIRLIGAPVPLGP